ncbi:MAG TPA: DNA polymerase III subunit delta [Gemmatimonadaceae bacterium]|nr:DNA polymerase III subunit delta [Gemmatimonadaceae bacterium]
MPLAAIDALDDAVARGTPAPVYLFHGDNDFLKEEKLRDVVTRLSDPATRDFNVDAFRGAETDAGRLSHALDALPMMAARRVVVVRDVAALKKDARAALDRYLDRPSPETVLLLVAQAGWKPDASIMGRAMSVAFAALDGSAALKWIATRAAAAGGGIAPDAAKLLLAATGPDLSMIEGELHKLRDFSANGAISAQDVAAVVGVSAGKTTTDLIDLVCARDGLAAAGLVPAVMRQPKASAVGIVMSLTAHLLGIGQVLVDRANRVAPRQQAANLYAMMGEARSAPVGRPWSEAVGAMTRHADRWDCPGVDHALMLLAGADSALKEAGVSSDEQVLSTLVMSMCASRRATRAA